MTFTKNDASRLNKMMTGKTAEDIIRFFLSETGEKITFGTSLGAEDQVITRMLVNSGLPFSIFTLDTGRLFPETYDLIDRTNKYFKIKMDVFFPRHDEVEEMVKTYGINLFYQSVELRKHCCQLRKLNPLKRALAGRSAWFTGLRRAQSVTRVDMQTVEWDENSKMLKINPLIEWTEEQVWQYIRDFKIPYNVLHDKGYPSIGCQPCTRAVMEGEEVRAGRWWWENPDTKECGLHKK